MSRLDVVGGRAMHDARNKRGTRSREREESTLDLHSFRGEGMDAACLVNMCGRGIPDTLDRAHP